MIIEHEKRRVNAVKGKDTEEADAERKAAQGTFYAFKTDWVAAANSVLGHEVYPPPIRLSAGTADVLEIGGG